MSGGGGDARGEFLLQLLRNPPQQPRQQAPQPPAQNLPHDPAVAVVGPNISFPTPLYQSNGPSGHEHLSHRSPWPPSPTHFAPHNFFVQNPNPNLSSASPPRPGFDQAYQQNHQLSRSSNLFSGDDVRKVGSFGMNPKLNSAHQQLQSNLMFGSLPFDIHNNAGVSSSNSNQLPSDDRGRVGLGNRIQNGLEIEFQKSLELNRNKELNAQAFGDHGAEKSDKKKRDKDYRSDKRGQWMLPQRVRKFRRQIECRRDINQLNTAFLTIYESLIPSEEEKAKQNQLLALLEKRVTKEWPEAQLYLYGSCANSFGFRKSDIDVCLAIEDADVNKSEVLLKLADILQSDNLQNVQALTRARVPIVKLMDPVTGISCDICVNNLLAVENTKLLRDYARIDARLQQLAFIVKHWAKLRGVNEAYQGTLSSYAYVLMCIHFLQQCTPAILPCLQGMERTYAVNVDNTECAYFDQVEELRGFGSRNKESIAQLVWAFFRYWAYYHNYPNDVISVRTGSILSKHEKGWTRRIGNDCHLICIEDPFEISHDLGRVVDKYSIRVLREEFERATDIMQNDSDPCGTLFKPYVPS